MNKQQQKKARSAHYTTRIADRICEHLANGYSLKQALASEPLSPDVTTIFRWLDHYPQFREKYERARMMQADAHADTMMEMAAEVLKNPRIATAYRVAADILQWQASMRNPKLYGNKVTVESKAPALNAAEIRKEIAALEKELNVNTASTAKQRDADERAPAAQPDPIVDSEPVNLRPSLFDDAVGGVQ